MSYNPDWSGPPPPTSGPPPARRGSGRKAFGCYYAVVAFLAVATVISFVATTHGTSPGLNGNPAHESPSVMSYLLLVLTVLLAIVPLPFIGIARAARKRRDEGGQW
jgi:hypothetical protein